MHASRNIYSSWRSIYGLFFCRQKKRTGRHKNTECSYIVVISLSRILGLKCTSSVLGTARLQHGFSSISFTPAGEKVPNRAGSMPAHFIKASWASMARLGSARCWHALVTFTLPLLIMPSHAGTVLVRFQVAVQMQY